MDSDASQFRRDRRGARGAAASEGSPDAAAVAVSGDTIGWDPEREVVVSASSIPAAVESTWAPSSDAKPAAAAPVASSPVPPSPAPPQSAAPAAAAPRPAPPGGGESVRIGWDAGQPALYSGDVPATAPVKRGLVSGATVLPEITEAPPAPRKLWRHPAFIVSMITTVLALGVAGTLIVLAALAGGPPRVSGLDLEAGSGAVSLSWSGPDTPYDVFVVGGGGEVADISQVVVGRGATVFRVFGWFDDDSCFVVRARSVTGDVSLAADDLDAQGAASVCVADADE